MTALLADVRHSWRTLRQSPGFIRAALGADRRAILHLILGRGLGLALLGLVIGAAGAIGLTRLMGSLLFGIGERDPLTLAVVALLLALIATLASYFPAYRATRVDPLVALRDE